MCVDSVNAEYAPRHAMCYRTKPPNTAALGTAEKAALLLGVT